MGEYTGPDRRKEPGSISLDDRLERIEQAIKGLQDSQLRTDTLVWKIIGASAVVAAVVGVGGELFLRALHVG